MTTREGRVRQGALWMDRHRPGWFRRVKPEALQMDSCYDCVLGQDFNSYYSVVPRGDNRVSIRDNAWAVAHGFSAIEDYREYVVSSDPRWTELRDLWVTEILSRRFAEQAAPVETPAAVASR